MIEKWWVILWIIGKAITLGIWLAKHGEHRDGKYNGWIALTTTAIAVVLAYYGGLFRCL